MKSLTVTYENLSFEQNCSIISIPGMNHEIMKWKLFSFSLTGHAKEWYSLTVARVEGNWNILKEKFCSTSSSYARSWAFV